MTVTEISNKYAAISRFISEKKLSEAFPALGELIGNVADYALREELENIRKTYAMMLHYYLEGSPDTRRDEMYKEIARRLSELNNRVNYRLMGLFSNYNYFSVVRKSQLHPATLDGLLASFDAAVQKASTALEADVYPKEPLREAEELQTRIFNLVWTRQYLTRRETEILGTLLSDTPEDDRTFLQTSLRCVIAGALYLGCSIYYDPARLKLLITCALNNSDTKVLARAYTLLSVLLVLYYKRAATDRTLRSMLSLLADAPQSPDAFRNVVISWIRTAETQKINKTISEEIIPGLMKLRPEIEKGFREMEGKLPDEDSGFNPAWEEFLQKSGLEEKLRRLNDLQMEGADMFMMAFARMKQLPFFRSEMAWFLPFSAMRTEVRQGAQAVPHELGELMESTPLFCHTDRYSMFLGFSSVPKSTLDVMSQQIKAQLGQFKEDSSDALKDNRRARLGDEISLFVKDLFRFYNQFSEKAEYRNPFPLDLDFLRVPALGDLLREDDTPGMLGSLYFHRGLWKNAIRMSEVIEERFKNYIDGVENLQSPADYIDYRYLPGDEDIESVLATVLERKGFAEMKLKDYRKAIHTLTRAQRYQAPSVWVLSNLARCFRKLGDAASSACFLDAALRLDPDNMRLLLRRGRLDMETGSHDAAVKIFYKLLYLHPENQLFQRMLAWCRCLRNEPEKALKLYEAIPSAERDDSDILNMGHCLLYLDRQGDAKACYAEYISRKNLTEFLSEVRKDIGQLPFLKGKEEELMWVCDAAAMGID